MTESLSSWQKMPLIVLCVGSFMTLLDVTIVNVAIPSLLGELDAGLEVAGWVVSLYTLPLAVFVATFGKAGDVYGKKQSYLVGVALFTAASLVCALAPSIAVLLAGRIVQGIGAALALPQTLAIISVATPANKRTTALGIHGSISGIASVLGPLLGGVIVDLAGWRMVFLVNIPIGLLVIFFGARYLPSTAKDRSRWLDWPAVGLITVALTGVTFALLEGGQGNTLLTAGLPIALSIAAFLALYRRLRATQHRDPLIPFALFRTKSYSLMAWVWASVSATIVSTYLPLMVYAQSVMGLSSSGAGLLVAPMFMCTVVVAAFAGPLARRWTAHRTLASGLMLFAIGLSAIAVVLSTRSTPISFLPGLILAGVGLGATFATMQSIAMRDIPAADVGSASGVINGVRQLSSALGGAGIVALLANGIRHAGVNATYSDGAAWQIAYTSTLQWALVVPIALMAASSLLTWRQGRSEAHASSHETAAADRVA